MELLEFNKYFQSYKGISEMIKKYQYEDIVKIVTQIVNTDIEELEKTKIFATNYKQTLNDLIVNIEYYDWLYEQFLDDTSKEIYFKMIQYFLLPADELVNFQHLANVNFATENNMLNLSGDVIKSILTEKDKIKNNQPELFITLDGIENKILEIAQLVCTITFEYKFTIRISQENKMCLFAMVLSKGKKEIKDGRKKVVAMNFHQGWYNLELTKDCGLIPFLLCKNHNCDTHMVGAKLQEYPYVDTYVKGIKMDFLETGSVADKSQYIIENAKDIDCLIIRGPYETNIDVTILYKKLNPNGIVLLGLDANSYWMDKIDWTRGKFIKFMDSCDIISTSCKAMQNQLNEKWPWIIEYLPNGYYNYGIKREMLDFSKKENTIITVARLGTPEKANHILLEAFAMIAEKIPTWNLKLIGGVDKRFEGYINEFYKLHPELSERVKFVGVIVDKEKLFEEYAKAKVFALTSLTEGGTPNVLAEALTGGCAIAITKIDAWEDAIDYGRCGMATNKNDVIGFAKILEELCCNSDLEEMGRNAYEYAMRNFEMETITNKINEMLFGGDYIE